MALCCCEDARFQTGGPHAWECTGTHDAHGHWDFGLWCGIDGTGGGGEVMKTHRIVLICVKSELGMCDSFILSGPQAHLPTKSPSTVTAVFWSPVSASENGAA